MDVRETVSYYATLETEAKKIVEKLRDVGIKAYITGGLALDYYTSQLHPHSDIDIMIDGFSNDLVGRVDSVMRSLGYTAVHWGARKNGTTSIIVFEKEFTLYNVVVDIFFKSFNGVMPFFGEMRGDPENDYYLHKAILLVHYGIGAGITNNSRSKDAQRFKELLRTFFED